MEESSPSEVPHPMDFLYFLLIGLAAGWIAAQVMKSGIDLITTLIVGVIGAIVGGALFRALGLMPNGLLGSLIAATVGAILCIVAVRFIKKKL